MTKQEFLDKLNTKEIDNRRFSIQKRAPDISKEIELFFGDNFSQQTYNYIHEITIAPICKLVECQHTVKFVNNSYGYANYCCKECEKKSLSRIKLAFSDEKKLAIQAKRRKTTKELYGVENIAQSKDIKEKIKNTNLEKYGVVAPMQNVDILKKREDNNLKKWGVKYKMSIPENMIDIQIKKRITENDKIIKIYQELGLEVLDFKDKMITCKCSICHQPYTVNLYIVYQRTKSHLEACTNCHPKGDMTSSQFQKQVYKFVQTLTDQEVILSDRKALNKKELDIYIPSLKLGIECNGVFWHSELKLPKDYHKNKYQLAESKDIHLIQVWQDYWVYKQAIVKSMLQEVFNKNQEINYSQCTIRDVKQSEAKEFFNINHLEGHIKSKLYAGLYLDDVLMCLMAFKGERVLRFCHKINYTVYKGEYKLMQYYINTNRLSSLTVESNLDWSKGLRYADMFNNNIPFIRQANTDIDYTYLISDVRQSKTNFNKSQLVFEGFDANLTEHEIMLSRKIYRVYDTGKAVWNWYNHLNLV